MALGLISLLGMAYLELGHLRAVRDSLKLYEKKREMR